VLGRRVSSGVECESMLNYKVMAMVHKYTNYINKIVELKRSNALQSSQKRRMILRDEQLSPGRHTIMIY
jgi:hypothetical protein